MALLYRRVDFLLWPTTSECFSDVDDTPDIQKNKAETDREIQWLLLYYNFGRRTTIELPYSVLLTKDQSDEV